MATHSLPVLLPFPQTSPPPVSRLLLPPLGRSAILLAYLELDGVAGRATWGMADRWGKEKQTWID